MPVTGRRLSRKTRDPQMSDALRWEIALAEGMAPLPLDTRRRHVHFTLYKTSNPADVHPTLFPQALLVFEMLKRAV